MSNKKDNLHEMLDLILEYVEKPNVQYDKPFAMLATLLDSDKYLGRCLIGKVEQGTAQVNDNVKSINLATERVESGRLTKLFKYQGTNRIPVEKVTAGDIICIAGLAKTSVSDTICNELNEIPIKSTPIDPPTMSITITVNDSPISGMEGKKVTSTVIRERLLSEAESNVAISFSENDKKDSFEIGGRGELQLGVLVETMRREGFELTVSRPKVVYKINELGEKLEPIEEVIIDVDDDYTSIVIDNMNKRKASMVDISNRSGKTRLIFKCPSRSLIGYQSQFLTDTRGTGVMNRLFDSYKEFKGEITSRRNGALIANSTGNSVAYAIFNLQDRGIMFIEPQTKVYQGMIVGEHNRPNDLEINILKGKQLTNVRASGSDEAVKLVPPKKMSLEQMMSYINDDEVLEVTPINLRLRKKHLNPHDRKRATKL